MSTTWPAEGKERRPSSRPAHLSPPRTSVPPGSLKAPFLPPDAAQTSRVVWATRPRARRAPASKDLVVNTLRGKQEIKITSIIHGAEVPALRRVQRSVTGPAVTFQRRRGEDYEAVTGNKTSRGQRD